MLARNATIFTLTPEASAKLNASIDDALAKAPFRPCGSLDRSSLGFVPFAPKEGKTIVRRAAGKIAAFTLRVDEKILPGCVVKSEVEARAADIEEREGRKVGRKERRDIKDRVTEELLAKAFIRSVHVSGWFDFANGLLVVDTTSESRAETVTSTIFKAIADPAGIARWRMETGITATMTKWVLSNDAPLDFTLDDSALLAGDDGAKVRLTKQTVTATEIRPLLENGKDCVEVAMTYDDNVSFVLTEKLILKRLTYLDIVEEKNPQQKDLLAEDLLEAELSLSAGSIAALVKALGAAFVAPVEELAKAA